MKIRTREASLEKVLAMKPYTYEKPIKQLTLLRYLMRIASTVDLMRVGFRYKKLGMEKLEQNQPCLVLMNHSCFIDMEIAAVLLGDRPYQIVCTMDALAGKKWLMKLLGCFSTKKYITDMVLVKNMMHAIKHLNSSILMYPEACYSFDGTATALPDSLAKCIKLLKVPVVMIRTYGAFSRDPLYNGLQKRKVKVSADMEYILSPDDIKKKSVEEIRRLIEAQFSFDHFKWQQENEIKINEKFRADGLNRVLYKCPHCHEEGQMEGKGIHLTCHNCGQKYELTEYGYLEAVNGHTIINHIPDWYRWQRECVKKELLDNTYKMDLPVDIYLMVNTDGLYKVGDGQLVHDFEGFKLTGCEGMLDFHQRPESSYTLNADFFFYEIGDVICVGDEKIQYYCFPKIKGDFVAKARLATEELYKIKKASK